MTDDDVSPFALAQAANEASPEHHESLRTIVAAHFEELRSIARLAAAGESADNSLNPTALVHEAYLRLVDKEHITQRGWIYARACFASEFRRLLVDNARSKRACRRGGDRHREPELRTDALGVEASFDLVEIDDLLHVLAQSSPGNARAARLVELRLFGNLNPAECAEALGVSRRTIDYDWEFARTWLQTRLDHGPG